MNKNKEQMPVKYKQLDNEQGSDFYFERSLDLIFSPGCFTVEIDHSGKDVGLPVDDCGEEHYLVGNLVVTDSGTAGHKQENRVTGQQLTITSRKGKETEVFTRTFADGVWSKWRTLAATGMYNNISTTDELLATVESLVSENTRAKEVEESVKRTAVDISSLACTADNENVTITGKSMGGEVVNSIRIPAATTEKAGVMSAEDKRILDATTSRLGFYDETITLTSADLMPMAWNGTKMVSSNDYNIWVIPLYNGRRYKCRNTAFIQSLRVCSKRPMLEENLTPTPARGIETGTFVATEETRYLMITVYATQTSVSGKEAYDGSNYEVSGFKSGLIEKNDKIVKLLNTEVDGRFGEKDRTIVLTSDNYDGLMWNGTAFTDATSFYNGFVIPIYPGERIKYIDNNAANSVCTLTEYPTVGSSERLRTRTELKGDFIVQDNEHYLFLNATVSTFTSYKVIANEGSVLEQIDALKQQQSPLYGKTIVCFGDSITEFSGSDGKGWCDYLATMSGANVVKAGVGGTQLATRKTVVETPTDYLEAYGAVDISNLVKAWATNDWLAVDNAIAWLTENKSDNNSTQIERLKATPIENTDIVIVFGGTNDIANATFGAPTDTNPVANTCGGINQLIDSILSVKPDMPIYFFTPTPRMTPDGLWCDDYRADQSDSIGSLSMPSLIKRIKECVELNHVPCCDMYNTIGVNRKNIYTYAPDGVHFKYGYSMITNKIYGFIMANRNWQ